MAMRIGVHRTVADSRAIAKLTQFKTLGLSKKPTDVSIEDSYVIDASVQPQGLKKIAEALVNPIAESASIDTPWMPEKFSYAIEIGFHPGVTDNVGNTCREMIA